MALRFLNSGYFAGKVGIGVESPSYTLQVGDGTEDSAIAVYYSDGSYTRINGYGLYMSRVASYIRPVNTTTQTLYVGSPTHIWNAIVNNANTHSFSTGAVEHMRILSNGKVGIGTGTPTEKLAVQSSFLNTASNSFIEINSGHEASGGSDLTGEAGILFKQAGSGNVLRNAGSIVSGRESNYSTDNLGDSYLSINTAVDSVNTEKIRITSGGNVGIGTDEPSQKLTIRDDSATVYSTGDASTNTGDLVLQNNDETDDNFNRISFQSNSDNNQTGDLLDAARITAIYPDHAGGNPSGELAFETKADAGGMAEAMRIDRDGKVGIGTDSPNRNLHVYGQFALSNADNSGSFLMIPSASTNKIYSRTADNVTSANALSVVMNSAEVFHITTGSRVGIRNTDPLEELDVRSTSFSTVAVSTDRKGATENIGSFAFYGQNDATTPERLLYTRIMSSMPSVTDGAESGDIYFQQIDNGTIGETVRILSSGNVGIGTDNPAAPLQVGSITATTQSQVTGEVQIVGSNHDISDTQMGTLNLTSTSRRSSAPFNQGYGPSITFSQNGSGYVNGWEKVIGGIKTELRDAANLDYASDMKFYTHTNTALDEQMRIDANGNVGINTSGLADGAPDLLTISGDAKYIAHFDGTNYAFKLGADSSGDGNFQLYNSSGDVRVKLYGELNAANYINNNGNFGLGESAPLARLHVKEEDTLGVKTVYGSSIIEALDAQLDLLSGSDGTWGSAINFVESDGVDANTDVWSIARQTTGGSGDSRLSFNFGTVNQHDNTAQVIFASDGTITSNHATISSDGASTLTTKGYVDSLITGATIYRGAWQPGISATSSAATTASTTLTVTAAILDADGNTPVLVGAVVTGAGITGTVKVASVTSSTVYVLDTAINATATAYIFSPIYGAPSLDGVTETSGYYYICSEAGSATPNGADSEPNTWNVGDWVIYNDVSGTGQWQKIDNSSVLSGIGTGTKIAKWAGASTITDSDTLENSIISDLSTSIDVDGGVTGDYFRTDETTTDYSLITRDSAGNASLYVQHASDDVGQPLARFSYGATNAGGGTTVLQVSKDNSHFLNTKVGIGTASPGTINGVAFTDVGLHVASTGMGRTITSGATWAEYILNDEGASVNERAKFMESNQGVLSFGSYDDDGTQRTALNIKNNGQVRTLYNLEVGDGTRTGGDNMYIRMGQGLDVYVNREFDFDPQNVTPAILLLCAYAPYNNVNGSVQMDRTSGLRHSCRADIVISAGSGTNPVGVMKATGVSGAGEPSYRLVKFNKVDDTTVYIGLEITNPDGYYENTGAYFNGRLTSTGESLVAVTIGTSTGQAENITVFEENGIHDFHGDVEIQGNLAVSGQVDGDLTIADDLTVVDQLTVGGVTTLNDPLNVDVDLATAYTTTSFNDVGIVLRNQNTDNVTGMYSTIVLTASGWEGQSTGVAQLNVIQEGTNLSNGTFTIKVRDNGSHYEAFRIKYNGNVGIGTSDPGSLLHVEGSKTTAVLQANQTGTGVIANFKQAGSSKVIIDNAGNVGIGATDPLRKLHVVGNFAVNAATDEYYGVNITGGEGANPNILIGDWHNSSANIKWDSTGNYLRIDAQHSTSGAPIVFSGNDSATEYMRITSVGKVGIGVTNPTAKLHVDGDLIITDTPQGQGDFLTVNPISGKVTTVSSKDISFGEAYINNYRSRVLDYGGTYFPTGAAGNVAKHKTNNLFNLMSMMLLPGGVFSGKITAAKPKTGVDFTWTRTTVANYTNEEGVITEAPIATPRIDYANNSNGEILIEPTRTNLVPNSGPGDYGNGPGSELTVPGPNGIYNSAIVPVPNNGSDRYQYTIPSGTYNDGDVFTYSWYRRRLSTPLTDAYLGDLQLNVLVNCTQTGDTVQIESNISGFDRFSAEVTLTLGNTNALVRAYFGNIVGTGNSSVAYFGHQLELGDFATTLINTTGNAETRDNDYMIVNNLSDTIFQGMVGQGGMYMDFDYKEEGSADGLRFYDENNITPRVYLYQGVTGISDSWNSGSFTLNQTSGNKIGYMFTSTTSAVYCANGANVVTSSPTAAAALDTPLDTLYIDGNQNLIRIRELSMFTQMTSAQLVTLTSL